MFPIHVDWDVSLYANIFIAHYIFHALFSEVLSHLRDMCEDTNMLMKRFYQGTHGGHALLLESADVYKKMARVSFEGNVCFVQSMFYKD